MQRDQDATQDSKMSRRARGLVVVGAQMQEGRGEDVEANRGMRDD